MKARVTFILYNPDTPKFSTEIDQNFKLIKKITISCVLVQCICTGTGTTGTGNQLLEKRVEFYVEYSTTDSATILRVRGKYATKIEVRQIVLSRESIQMDQKE